MGEERRKGLNKNHPDCERYTARFKALWDAYFELEKKEKAKYPDWKGLDHPAYEVLRPAHKKMCAEIKALQEEYAYLFTEEELTEDMEERQEDGFPTRRQGRQGGRQGDGSSVL